MSKSNEHIYRANAKRIPPAIRKVILQEDWINKAELHAEDINSPMGFLFERFAEYISQDHNDWHCGLCRHYVQEYWKKLEPYLREIETEAA